MQRNHEAYTVEKATVCMCGVTGCVLCINTGSADREGA